jgi:hypothetical protein
MRGFSGSASLRREKARPFFAEKGRNLLRNSSFLLQYDIFFSFASEDAYYAAIL